MITKALIEQRISEEGIFRKYIGYDFKFGVPFLSELRAENHSSANVFYSNLNGKYLYKDYGDSGSVDCYGYVMRKFNVDFKTALEKIAFDCGITESSPIQVNDIHIAIPKIELAKDRAQFDYETKPFEGSELKLWASYGIIEETLVEYEVSSVLWVQQVSEDKIHPLRESTINNPIFMIKIGEGFKFYLPYEDPKLKWMSNTRISDIFGLKQAVRAAEKGKLYKLGLLAGQKDIMSLYSNTGIRSIGLNSESGRFRFATYMQLKEIAEWLFVLYDNDKTGILNMMKIEKEYHITAIYLNKFLNYSTLKGSSGIDDVADWYKYKIEHDLKQDKVHLLINYEKEQYDRNTIGSAGKEDNPAQTI